jgi:hypothetical protein
LAVFVDWVASWKPKEEIKEIDQEMIVVEEGGEGSTEGAQEMFFDKITE